MIRTARILIATISFALWQSASAVWAGEINLRRSIRMHADRSDLTLSDVAALSGDDAEQFSGVVIWTNPDSAKTHEIDLATIRERLNNAGVPWATVHLRGGNVTVRPPTASTTNGPASMQPAAIGDVTITVPREYREDTFLAAGIMHEQTVRGAIAVRFVHALAVDPGELRMTFSLSDTDLLTADLSEHRVELQPTSSLEGDRTTFAIRFWRDDSIERQESVSVCALVRAPLAQLARDVSRGEQIMESDLVVTHEWISPALARKYPERADLIGLLAARNLSEGTPLRDQDVQREALVTRGERVTVRCVSGNVVISLTAEARSDAAMGETVELRKFGERDEFTARITGPGEAIVELTQR